MMVMDTRPMQAIRRRAGQRFPQGALRGALLAGMLPALLLAGPPVLAQEDGIVATQSQVRELDRRLDRIERRLDSSALADMLRGVEEMQRDLRNLRGEVDTLNHRLDRLEERQRDQFAHLDERLATLEAGGVASEGEAPQEEVVDFDLPDAGEQEAYQEAFSVLMDGDYAGAIRQLEAFIERFPDGDFAANAWYWLAEAKYASGDFEAALEDFERLREQFPESDKQGDALLKIGYSHYELEDFEAASEALEQVREEYGGTTLDRLARERLQRMDGS
ncbi:MULTISPECIES: tol-pal system protein YbgF [unclassified Thioalkalivibrio]|uniref:tol-pal system protein YbgF n=1 Tax=unclassified Thioalkalivibrio TaxID=2621013 RepID=UPI00036E504D|nr:MULTISPECIES: tol-pal system protein YbgF [unclassified Thioalkalivibrio]PYG02602.1 tol-pal system protein YbgF [Thioalkalivibrio sp. ALE21]